MDESWRCTMGSVLPRRRSADNWAGGGQSLAPDDFRDVFGGPPRTVILRHFCGEPAARSTRDRHGAGASCRRPYDGRSMAQAAVRTEAGFFDDIFGARGLRSRSRSKSKSSSVVSSEELGQAFCRPAAAGGRCDAALSSFASKLRPIAIPPRRYDSSPPSTMSTWGEYQSNFTCSTAAYPASRQDLRGRASSSAGSSESSAAAYHRHRLNSSFCCFTSTPETKSLEPSFRRTRHADTAGSHASYYGCSSPSSAVSSAAFGNPPQVEEVMVQVRNRAPLAVEDDDIHSVGAAAVDEAIAWAKEKFWSQMSRSTMHDATNGIKKVHF